LKRNNDYLFYILSAVAENYEAPLKFKDIFQTWVDSESPSQKECIDFALANRLLMEEGCTLVTTVTSAGEEVPVTVDRLTWKGYDLLEQLRVKRS